MLRKNLFGVLLLVFSLGCANSLDERTRFHVRHGQLMRGDRPFALYAVSAPESLVDEWDVEKGSLFLNRICANGGNGVTVDLTSSSDGEAAVDQSWLQNFLALISAAKWREMAVVLRLFPPGSSWNTEWRRRLVDELTTRMKGRWDVIYWVEGTDAGYFKKRARKLTALGANDGDLWIGEKLSEKPTVAIGNIPDRVEDYAGFILPQGEESLELIQALYAITSDEQSIPPQGLIEESEIEEGFVPLFDGRTLRGWVATGEEGGWTASDGSIDWVRAGGRYLRTRTRFGDFVLRFDWKIEANGNSGVFIHAPLNGRWSRIGMEIQLLGDFGKPPHKNGTGSVYDVVAPSSNAARPAGEWNSMEVFSEGSHLRVTLNGIVVQDLQTDQNHVLRLRLREGFIAFQDHGNPVSFRNIRIRRL